ncbi:YheU family protein [Reinekea sp. G2M2-21]|uniref:YheU family protein n=1 Tax=Reinekea sp. G2M2-21 TaxID=2788942 RepID=UPI0018ABE883|nr:YheU family protein [Reinekea sp. G2M2-21]
MIIPHKQLPPETLQAVIEDWLSRQSQETDIVEMSRQSMIDQVLKLLDRGKMCVTWDDESQTINLLDAETAKAREQEFPGDSQ